MNQFIDFVNQITLERIFNFIMNPEFTGVFLVIKIIFVAISSFFIGAILWLLTVTQWLRIRHTHDLVEISSKKSVATRKLTKEWDRIKKRLESKRRAEYKIAVIDSENLLERILKEKGYTGDTMGECLKQIDESVLENIQEVWTAHKVRNHIVHDSKFKLSLKEAQDSVSVFHQAFEKIMKS
tara:strand:+ start:661 stop:1206 length:546 start_codon:yes stop_codon:yes gene_type:complete